MALKGIDVSVWNGQINWSLTKKEIDFAILRIGFGRLVSQKDTKFEANYAGCKANNIPIGGYWYNYAKTVDDAKKEAQACIQCLNGRKMDYPVWYDIEENSVFATGKDNVSKIAETFCEALKAAGYKVGLYSSYNAFQNYFTDDVKKKYDVWLAHVGNNGVPLTSTGYPGHKEMWQYSWKGKYSGINGDVDEDWSYVNYAEKKEEVKPVESIKPIETAKPAIPNKNIDTYYRVFTGMWWSEIKNTNDVNSMGYAGVETLPIYGLAAKASEGKLRYRVHTSKGNKWFDWIEGYNVGDWNNGVAGYPGYPIDGIQMELIGVPGYQVQYRSSLVNSKNYLGWIKGYGEGSNGYSGIFGKSIDKVQIKIVKA